MNKNVIECCAAVEAALEAQLKSSRCVGNPDELESMRALDLDIHTEPSLSAEHSTSSTTNLLADDENTGGNDKDVPPTMFVVR